MLLFMQQKLFCFVNLFKQKVQFKKTLRDILYIIHFDQLQAIEKNKFEQNQKKHLPLQIAAFIFYKRLFEIK